MTYLEKWFDYNRRQKEMETLLEETIAQQSEQRLTLKEFYLGLTDVGRNMIKQG